ncbi:MAG: hydrogenase maturation nickel metallochaperone HypA [Proteobacteria bacterium]|jgi:hydrogenase nickel incorporation protein HypA/HybF|nr:hydrogenase maturation nickel metallochaperone HypA [Pseudomonadota bacterium]
MHEVSLATQLLSIIEDVAKEHSVSRVVSAALQIGEFSCVNAETLAFAFEVVSRGTVAEGCALQVEAVPLTVRCGECGFEGVPPPEKSGCPSCDCPSVAVVGGREMNLVSVEVDDA